VSTTARTSKSTFPALHALPQCPLFESVSLRAAFTQGNGIVRIHPEVCMGGAKCKAVCPWHIPERQSGVGLHLDLLPQYAGNGVMYKCDRCYQRLEEGELPACIEVCPEDVQQIGPRQEIVEKPTSWSGK
jgi:formate dehydrogenase iron-sulfur subunit